MDPETESYSRHGIEYDWLTLSIYEMLSLSRSSRAEA